ncbi:MAG: NAD-binding protein [Anaerolineae bacterium]|nr:NAD-binding protein [Anaerolineae bacterium]
MTNAARVGRLARAYVRDVRVLLTQFRFTLLIFCLLLVTGTLILHLTYDPLSPAQMDATGKLRWGTALHAVFSMMFFETPLEHPRHVLSQAVFLLWPALGLILVVNGVVGFGTALITHRERKEAWQVAVASTYRNHVVVCGLGRVGYRVALQLLTMQQEVVGVESDATGPFLDAIQAEGVPVLIGDARNRDMLEKAGVAVASAIVACTEDDLTNLEIALDARDLNPDIKVVMRMFDQRLAERIRKGFGIHTAFSTSALAAPALAAAATRAAVEYSFYVDDVLLNVSSLGVDAGSALVGRCLNDVEQTWDVSIILYRGSDGVDLHPVPERVLAGGDQIVVFATLDALARLDRASRGQPAATPRADPPTRALSWPRWLRRHRDV